MIKVSVIVPVYNIEKKLLEKCIQSILEQTLDSIEIILVDDASTNRETIKILETYKLKEKVTLIKHKQNKKQGGARNTGLKAAKGEYIGFVDADDYVHLEMYRLLYTKALEDNADIVDCDLVHVDDQGKVLKYEKSINKMDNSSLIKNSGRNVSKLFRKELLLINKIYFPENMFFEDNAISSLHILYASKISKINKYLYYYVRHSSSTISNISLHLSDKIKAGQIFYNTMNERGFFDKYNDIMQLKYFEVYFKTTYRLVMKYDSNYINTLKSIIHDMQSKGVVISSENIQSTLKTKEKFEIWVLLNIPKIFKLYVDMKYNKYKVSY